MRGGTGVDRAVVINGSKFVERDGEVWGYSV